MSTIRQAIQFYTLKNLINNETSKFSLKDGDNPVSLMVKPPANYAGEITSDMRERVTAGSWYYDKTNRELIYPATKQGVFKQQVLLRYRLRYVKHVAAARSKIALLEVNFDSI